MSYVADEIADKYLNRTRIKEGYISAACPFHKGGQERHPSFWIRREDGKWGCFSCSEGGPDLRSLMRGLGVSNRLLDATLEEMAKEAKSSKELEEAKRKKKNRSEFKGEHILPEALLGVYDWCPEELLDAGFTEETLMAHDVGYDKKRNRITFPIRDVYGNLIGISGRNLDCYPKYKVYTGKRINDAGDVDYGELGEYFPHYSSENIRNHLWRGQHVYFDTYDGLKDELIIVEGYKAAMWLVQHGFTQTVALMGNRMTKMQERLICKMGVSTWVFLDNNDPGLEAANRVCNRLASGTFPVYRCYYMEHHTEDTQPDDMSEEELESVLSTARRTGGKRYGYRKNYVRKR